MQTIAVLGAGSWGTAIAVHLGRLGHRVHLWARDPRLAAEIETRRANAVYLPDVTLPAPALRKYSSFRTACMVCHVRKILCTVSKRASTLGRAK